MLAEFITVNDRLEILERKLEITNNEIADLKQTIENVERKIKHQKKTEISNKNVSEVNAPVSYESLKLEIENFKEFVNSENQYLKNQIKFISKRTERISDKIKSFDDVARELRAFFSIDGYSKVFNTKSLFGKLFILFGFTVLFSFCLVYVSFNVNDYYEHDVVTQIKNINDEQLVFPAITFCLLDFSESPVTPRNLSDVFIGCHFESIDNKCFFEDFEDFVVYNPYLEINYPCYKFNGGKNASNHVTKLLSTQDIGYFSGLNLRLKPSNSFLYYYVGYNGVRPTNIELSQSISLNRTSGQLISARIQKTDDIKLPYPYSNCTQNINVETSYLVKEIIEKNITYRQVYCYELCYHNYLRNYARAQNITVKDAFDIVVFDFKNNCSQICPLECSSTYYQTLIDEEPWKEQIINFHYIDRKYTVITQTIKTTVADLVSNTGGVVGLFLDFTFLHVYKFLIHVFDFFSH